MDDNSSQSFEQPSQKLESDGEESLPESPYSRSSVDSLKLPSTLQDLNISYPPQAHNSPAYNFQGVEKPAFDPFKLTEALWPDAGTSELSGLPASWLLDEQVSQSPFSLPEKGTVWNFNAITESQAAEWEKMGLCKIMAWDASSSTNYDSDGLFSPTFPYC